MMRAKRRLPHQTKDGKGLPEQPRKRERKTPKIVIRKAKGMKVEKAISESSFKSRIKRMFK